MTAIRERDRIERQRFEQRFEQEQREAEESRLAPVRAAEAELSRTAGKLLEKEREAALNGTGDLETAHGLLSPAMKQLTPERGISEAQASQFNEREARKFAENTPDFYACPENADLITSYCSRHGISVADAETFRNVFRHLDALGLMEHAPERQPEPVIEQETPALIQTEFEGVDESGRPKSYTRAEVDRMSADEYRRFFQLPTKQVIEYREKMARW